MNKLFWLKGTLNGEQREFERVAKTEAEALSLVKQRYPNFKRSSWGVLKYLITFTMLLIFTLSCATYPKDYVITCYCTNPITNQIDTIQVDWYRIDDNSLGIQTMSNGYLVYPINNCIVVEEN